MSRLLSMNPASFRGDGERLLQNIYSNPGCLFDYAGIDVYYGTWISDGPETWLETIERLHS
ncbi:MAG: hypothetical protein ACOX8S_03785 [Christensenellales bacterium]